MRLDRSVRSLLLLTCMCVCTMAAQGNAASKDVRQHAAKRQFFLYIGTFTGPAPNGHPDGDPPSKGIYLARFDTDRGGLSAPVLAAEVADASFLAVSPNQRFLYAVTENHLESFVSAYAIDRHTGGLRVLNKVPTGGSNSAYVSLDKKGRFVLLANYRSGSVTAIRIHRDGSLGLLTSLVQHSLPGAGVNAETRAPVPHPHATVASPDNRFVLVPDLGLNALFVYKFDAAKGVLMLPARVVDLPPDDEPRHFVFSPDGAYGYLNGQKRGNVDVFHWDRTAGALSRVQTVESFPKSLDAVNMSAEIGMTPNGRFLYESNRRTHGASHELGPDSIVAYQVNQKTGALTEVQDTDLGASIPRCFSIDPTGAYMAIGGQQSDRVTVYSIDPENGRLSDSGVSIRIHAPACMQFVRAQ
jgi:6-phosphogluconolactonase